MSKKTGVWKKDAAMESSEEEEVVKAPVLAKIKARAKAATKVTKNTAKSITKKTK